jgi:hypothetical protein
LPSDGKAKNADDWHKPIHLITSLKLPNTQVAESINVPSRPKCIAVIFHSQKKKPRRLVTWGLDFAFEIMNQRTL